VPIIAAQAPLDVTARLYDELPRFLSGPDYGSAGNIVSQASAGPPQIIPSAGDLNFPVGGSPPNPFPDFNPIQVFALGIGNVMQGLGISAAAVPVGWRLFITNPSTQSYVMAWISQLPTGVWKMAAAYYGLRVNDLLDASQGLAPLLPGNDPYELRMLILPWINLQAFWLKAQVSGVSDVLVPYPAMSAQLIASLYTQPSYTEAQFLAAIKVDIARWQTSFANAGG
jgi:hypothetical protein